MALNTDDVHRIGEIVRTAVAEAMLGHFQTCPQQKHIETLYAKAESNGLEINGVAASLAHVSDSLEAAEAARKVERTATEAARKLEREAAEALSKGRREGIRIGAALAIAAGTSGGTAVLMKLFGL